MQEIIDYSYDQWIEEGIYCESKCGGIQRVKNYFRNRKDILIVRLLSYQNEPDVKCHKVTDFEWTSFENQIIYISGDSYQVRSAIVHRGSDIWPIQYGHYSNVLRVLNHWVIVDDSDVQAYSKLQKITGAYVIFLQKITVSDAEKIKENETVIEKNDDLQIKQHCSLDFPEANTAPAVLFQFDSIVDEIRHSTSQIDPAIGRSLSLDSVSDADVRNQKSDNTFDPSLTDMRVIPRVCNSALMVMPNQQSQQNSRHKIRSMKALQYRQMVDDIRMKRRAYYLSKKDSIYEKKIDVEFSFHK